MCGRFTLRARLNDFLAEIGLQEALEYAQRFNIAPSQNVPIVFAGQASLAKWGLVPSWAKDPKIGHSLINARAETIAEKPAFRSAFKRGRCLVVADGFYEWKKDGKAKQPYFIRLKNDKPFAFAGLREHWERDGQVIDSCTVITTSPNELMADIHDRMPVIVSPDNYDLWLDPEFHGKEKLQSVLSPYPADQMLAYPVSMLVNSPRNDVAECVVAVLET